MVAPAALSLITTGFPEHVPLLAVAFLEPGGSAASPPPAPEQPANSGPVNSPVVKAPQRNRTRLRYSIAAPSAHPFPAGSVATMPLRDYGCVRALGIRSPFRSAASVGRFGPRTLRVRRFCDRASIA
jgi:hypothetical protein